jgi:exodeoxyribonuclease VII large subunit
MKSLTVSELTQSIKKLIEKEFSSVISVKGEISGFSVSPSGHAYFILKDEKSKIKGVMFASSFRNLGSYYPKNGDKVIAVGNIKLYEPEGNYQIIVKHLKYDSVGDFYKLFEETKRKLEKDGFFDKDKKKPVKNFIRNIAVITSPSGAAIKDFLVTLKKNNITLNIDIYSSQVQGESAIPMIIQNIKAANQNIDKYDLLILMRGGGSLEDLSIFNDEYVAKALFDSKITTMSAIGHERDFTISDFVADIRVATPTAAAEYISNINLNFINKIDEFIFNIERRMTDKLNNYLQDFDYVMMKIQNASPVEKLNLLKVKMSNSIDKIINSIKKLLREKENLVDSYIYKINVNSPSIKFGNYKEMVFFNTHKIISLMERKIEEEKNIIYNLEKVVSNSISKEKFNYEKYILDTNIEKIKKIITDTLLKLKSELEFTLNIIKSNNPEHILNKGYAVVYKKDKMLTDVLDVNLDDELEIKLRNGYINSFVTGKRKI